MYDIIIKLHQGPSEKDLEKVHRLEVKLLEKDIQLEEKDQELVKLRELLSASKVI